MFSILGIEFSEEDLAATKSHYEYLYERYTYINVQVIETVFSKELLSKLTAVIEQTKGLTYVGLLLYIIEQQSLPLCICGKQTILNYRYANKQATNKCQPWKCNEVFKCPSMNASRNKKTEETSLRRYGVRHAKQSEQVKEKGRANCLEKYGVDNPFKSSEIKQKIEETLLNKYGVTQAMHIPGILDKRKAISMEKYGVEHQSQRREVREKIEKTNVERYGVRAPGQNLAVNEKMKQACLEKYGVDNIFKLEETKEKLKAYNMEKYGVDNPFKLPEFQNSLKEILFSRYGVDNVFKSEVVKAKIKKVLLEKYGVEHALQNPEFFQKFQRTSKAYKDIVIEGRVLRLQGYEEHALKWLIEDLKIPLDQIQCSLDDKKSSSIPYKHNNKNHIYYPDFLIGGKTVVEVKSTYTLYYDSRNYEKLVSKALECISRGFEFMLLLVVPVGTLHRVIPMAQDWYLKDYRESIREVVEAEGISFSLAK